MNEELFSEKKNRIKYYSFKDFERLIKKLKINYDEIEKIKKDIKPIIDVNNINTMEKNMNDIPKSFDQLTTSSINILDNITKNEKFTIN